MNETVEEISKENVNGLINEILSEWSDISFNASFGECTKDIPFKCVVREVFSTEFTNDQNRFEALPPEQRSYYLVYHKGHYEALFGINFQHLPNVAISSFARIIKKDQNTAPGWWYLDEMIKELFLNPQVAYITATLIYRGKNTFQKLKCRSPRDYTVSIKVGTPTSAIIRRV